VNPLAKLSSFAWLSTLTANNLRKIYKLKRRHASKEEFVEVYKGWSCAIFERMGYKIECTGEKPIEEPCIYVGNHVSFLDIPLVWTSAQAVYVAKKEVRQWPLIGPAAQELGIIWVDRSSLASRARVLDGIREGILEHKKRVCIFPEGTTSIDGKDWRWGVFKLAKELRVPIQPFRIFYCPLRDTSYIDEDTLTTQWWRCMDAKQKLASIDWGKPRIIEEFQKDAKEMQQWVRSSFDKIRAESNCG
jgi:1-acyl-sn-glycerol-3-phosphate acyltransferase